MRSEFAQCNMISNFVSIKLVVVVYKRKPCVRMINTTPYLLQTDYIRFRKLY